MEDYVVCGVLVVVPVMVVWSIAWGVARWLQDRLLLTLTTIDAVEQRLGRAHGTRKRFAFVSWEYLLAQSEAYGRTEAEMRGIFSQPQTAAGLLREVRRRSWALPLTGAPIVLLTAALAALLAWVGIGGLTRGEPGDAIFLGGAAACAAWAWWVLRGFTGTPDAAVGRLIRPLVHVAPAERVPAVRAMAREHVEAIRSLKRAAEQPGFSAGRRTVTETIAVNQRLSNRMWRGALISGGGLTLLKIGLRAVEWVAPEGPGAVIATLAVFVLLLVGGLLVWLWWYRSAQGRARLLRGIGAVPADREQYRSSWRALEQVAAAVGLADPPQLHVMDAPVLNAAVAGLSAPASAFVVTEWFSRLPEAEQHAAFATLMAHVVSGRAAKAAAPRLSNANSAEYETEMTLGFSMANETEGLQLTRTPKAHIALLERFVSGAGPSYALSWRGRTSPFADRRLWFYAPPAAPVQSVQLRLRQLRATLGAEAVTSGERPVAVPAPGAEMLTAPQPEDLGTPDRPTSPRSRPGATMPTAQDVASRAAALVVVGDRGLAEAMFAEPATPGEVRDALPAKVEKLRAWAATPEIAHALTPAERSILDADLGEATEQLVLRAGWGIEGLPVLLWVLGEIESLPPWDVRYGPGVGPKAVTEGDAELLAEWVASAELLPDDELELAYVTAEVWYWRAWMGERWHSGAPLEEGTYEETIARAAASLAEDGLITAYGEDYLARGGAYRDLDEDARMELRAIAWERYRAVSWLFGEIPGWDETPG